MKTEKARLIESVKWPLIFIGLMWLVKGVEYLYGISFHEWGVFPLEISGLPGIITAPFIHKDMNHLISNTVPLLISSVAIFYFYPKAALKAIFWMYLMTGIWIWCFERPSYHIGASGLVYAFVFFVFFSGVFRKDPAAMAASLLVTFLYGSLVWGILPVMNEVSWESHLMGSFAGILFAWYFRNSGNPTPAHIWKEDENHLNYLQGGETEASINAESDLNTNLKTHSEKQTGED